MRFFVDQCVPESAARSLEQRGHEMIRLRERIAPDSPDNLVAAISQSNDAILVTMDGDFKSIASRHGIGSSRFRRLSLLRFEKCRESAVAGRLERAMTLIEHEWEIGGGPGSRDRRMFVIIRAGSIVTYR